MCSPDFLDLCDMSSAIFSQAVVCAADDTIEVSSRRGSNGAPVIDGAGTLHFCRDSELVRTSVESSVLSPLRRSELRPGDTVSMLREQEDRES